MRKIISKLFRARRAARTSEPLAVAPEPKPTLAPTPEPAPKAAPSKRRYGKRKPRHYAGPGGRHIDPNGPIIHQARGKR
jgi:hypothetical protein